MTTRLRITIATSAMTIATTAAAQPASPAAPVSGATNSNAFVLPIESVTVDRRT